MVRCSKPQFNCPEVHDSWKNIAFGKLFIFSQNRIWSKSCMKVLWQLSGNLDKIAIQVSTETFWTKNVLFLIKTIFFLFTDSHWCVFEDPKKTILSVLSIRHSTYPEERLNEILSYKELELFYHLRTLNEKSLEFLPETSSQLSKVYLRVQATFTGKLFFWKMCKVFCPFCKLSEWASFLSELFSAGFLQLYSRLPEDLFQEELLVWEFFFNSSTIFGFERKIFGLVATTVLRHCQKCTFSDGEENEGNIILKKRIKPQQFSDFRVDRSVPWGAIFESSLQVYFFVSKATFRIKIYLLNKKFFVEFLDFELNFFGLFTRRFGHDFWICIYVSIGTSSPRTFSLKKGVFANSSVCRWNFFLFSSNNLR